MRDISNILTDCMMYKSINALSLHRIFLLHLLSPIHFNAFTTNIYKRIIPLYYLLSTEYKKHFIAFCSCCRLWCCCFCFSLCICHFYHAVFWVRGYHHQDISAAKCKTQRGHISRKGGGVTTQHAASCKLPKTTQCAGRRAVTKCWLQQKCLAMASVEGDRSKRKREAGRERGRQTDRNASWLLSTASACRHPQAFTIDSRHDRGHWRSRASNEPFFFIFVSLSWGRCTRPHPLSLSREEAPMNSRTAQVKTSLESHVAHNNERKRGAERERERARTIKGNCF